MRYERKVEVRASAEATWQVLADVESWPTWTPTFQQVELQGPLQEGTKVRIKQPGRGAVTYEIQELEPGRRFQWGSRGAGNAQRADHVVEPTASDSCAVTLTFEMTGVLGGLVGTLVGGKIRGMVDTEAESLRKRLSES
jgi:carbon monoxide dehydrogenase subunit G